MVRPTDQETVAIEKIVCYSSQEERACHDSPCGAGKHTGKQQVQSGSTESDRETWARTFTVVSLGKARQSRISSVRIY